MISVSISFDLEGSVLAHNATLCRVPLRALLQRGVPACRLGDAQNRVSPNPCVCSFQPPKAARPRCVLWHDGAEESRAVAG